MITDPILTNAEQIAENIRQYTLQTCNVIAANFTASQSSLWSGGIAQEICDVWGNNASTYFNIAETMISVLNPLLISQGMPPLVSGMPGDKSYTKNEDGTVTVH